jgi:hypothetical protein
MLKAAAFFDAASGQLTHLFSARVNSPLHEPALVRVEERLAGGLAGDPVAEDLDLDRRADVGRPLLRRGHDNAPR